ncbi:MULTISPECIES: restriction endonuclease subunit S [Shewanella]|uniref:restriction endonuclease subunit S n=1 Tax=Shewanella TaxID=22 RepID=UPI0004715D8C|nr:restriction endonuclease subunit S [Shewanella algae]TVL12696.1 hypothetical protein AYJ02_16935 [Shewanella algae]
MSEQATLNNKYVGYADYKDSRVEELGRLPATWGVKKVNYLFSFGRGLNITKANLEDTGIPVVNYGEVHSKYGFVVDPVIHPLKCVSSEYLKTNPGALLRRGDFVFADTSEDLEGAGNFTHFDGSCDLFAGYHTVVLRPQHDNLPRFLAYAFDSLECRSQVKLAVKGVKVFSVTQGILKDVALPVPPIEEQRTIAAFLDYETARIDSLIDKQQRLIELLKEKRQAVISHAVTKGLNPDALLKDSGVEWLGQVPEHWECSRVGWLCEIGNGMTPNRNNIDYWSEGHFPWLNSSKVNDGEVYFAEQFVTETAFAECSLPWVKSNSVIMAITGEGKTRGTTAITRIDTTINQHVAYMMPTSDRIVPDFLCMWLQSQYGRIRFESAGWGSTKAAITCSDIKAYPVPLPPVLEQISVVEFVKASNTKFDNLMAKATKQVDLLQERRTALISAAVTGKIDLRGWTQPVKEDAA